MILPLEAGGPGDVLARFLAQAMGKPLQQKVLIENIGGAGGNIGVARAAKAAPDGYALLLHHIGISTSPAMYRNLQFNPISDFEPIGLVAVHERHQCEFYHGSLQRHRTGNERPDRRAH